MAIVIRTEAWNTKQGEVIKAVVRDEHGKILGATNQTASVTTAIVGRK
jgi:hypothetical protein